MFSNIFKINAIYYLIPFRLNVSGPLLGTNFNNEKCAGGKLSVEKLKTKRVVTAVSAGSRNLKNSENENSPVIWKSNEKARITVEILDATTE